VGGAWRSGPNPNRASGTRHLESPRGVRRWPSTLESPRSATIGSAHETRRSPRQRQDGLAAHEPVRPAHPHGGRADPRGHHAHRALAHRLRLHDLQLLPAAGPRRASAWLSSSPASSSSSSGPSTIAGTWCSFAGRGPSSSNWDTCRARLPSPLPCRSSPPSCSCWWGGGDPEHHVPRGPVQLTASKPRARMGLGPFAGDRSWILPPS